VYTYWLFSQELPVASAQRNGTYHGRSPVGGLPAMGGTKTHAEIESLVGHQRGRD
jgi:hypothetical protein